MLRHPDRVLSLEGAKNFRDFGGYAGLDGRPVRWRTLFRSDQLGGLTEADRAALDRLGLARAFDFRGEAERAARPYELPGVVQLPLPIEPVVVQRMQALVAAGQTLTGPVVVRLMQDLYRALVNDQSHRFAELFELLLSGEGPAVLHCTAGKDRTGFAVALILLALGVSREQVLQDYLLTNEVFAPPPMPRTDTPVEALAVLWRVQQDFLDAALHAVDTDHGGIDRYLSQRLGLSDAARRTLRARYLEAG
jgi:protein-tyrosine phosphatase